MGLFDKLLGKSKKTEKPEHAVIVRFQYGMEDIDPLYDLEEKLENILSDTSIGEYDGHEIATDYSDGFLYMYGPDADTLFNAIKPTLNSTDFLQGAVAKLRFGPPEDGVKEISVTIGEN